MDDNLTINREESLVIIYDGECPFCRNFVRLQSLRKAGLFIDLVNARDTSALITDIASKHDLNDGMVVIFDDQEYYGKAALQLLARLSNPSGLLGQIARYFAMKEGATSLIYPVMKFGRNLTINLMGKSKI
jgi:predicted DCC family thiol-disulfide oxidoreductase YuxK